MKISICIPSYNKKGMIANTIESIHQNIKLVDPTQCSVELLINDDCSPDGSYELLKQLQPQYGYRLSQNNPNLGMIRNWNAMLEMSTGDYIQIFHGDDIMAPGALAAYVKYLIAHPDCAYLHSNAIDVSLPFFKTGLRITQQENIIPKGYDAVKKIILNNNTSSSTIMVARKCYEELGNFDENAWISGDWEMWARIGQVYDLHHISVVGAYVILDNNNTHTAGMPLKSFRGQQEYYIQKMNTFVAADQRQQMLQDCDAQLNKTLGILGAKYIQRRKFKLGLEYINSTNLASARKLSYIATGIKSMLGDQYRNLFHTKKEYSDIASLIKA